MASLNAEYTYITQLPYMLVKITSKRGDRPSSSGPRGLTYFQQALCNTVWEMKARVNADPEHCGAHPAIRQFQLERWVWERFWSANTFPGIYPSRVDHVALIPRPNIKTIMGPPPRPMIVSTWSAQHLPQGTFNQPKPTRRLNPNPTIVNSLPNRPQYRNTNLKQQVEWGHQTYGKQSNNQNTQSKSSLLRPLSGYALPYSAPSPFLHQHAKVSLPATSHPLELNLTPGTVSAIVNRIRQFRYQGYEPQHGWNTTSGLPEYAVMNTAHDAHAQWTGDRNEKRFSHVLKEFYPFRIEFQRLEKGSLIAWPEAGGVVLYAGGEEWARFCRLWAFLRTWVVHGNVTGTAENAVDHLQLCRQQWMNFNTAGLLLPTVGNGGGKTY